MGSAPPRIRRLPNTVAVTEPLRAVGTSLGALHMLTRHGHSDWWEMGDFGPYVKPSPLFRAVFAQNRGILGAVP